MINYLKIGKASDLLPNKQDYRLYRALEIMPAVLSLSTFAIFSLIAFYSPILGAYIIISFDVYWLLLVIYLSIHLISAYKKMRTNMKINWSKKCEKLTEYTNITHLVILPTYQESAEIIRHTISSIAQNDYPLDKIILVLAVEERAGEKVLQQAAEIQEEFGKQFKRFLITIHPDNIAGEIKGKGSNQVWAARQAQKTIIDKEKINYDKIIVSVFDIDTIAPKGFFHCLTHKFLTVKDPHRASYQPVPLYHNNVWQAPFFSRIAAASNSFWQMMQQIRQEKLATYSSHSMSFKSLAEVDFWSVNMVSEDSRIFWHSLLHYRGHYRVEPLHFPVSMDACMDKGFSKTAGNLYKQQRRWGWGVENVPYLIFNTIKQWDNLPKRKFIGHILIQVYGFHSWATNALIIALFGWLPILFGLHKMGETVLYANLPRVTEFLMQFAMVGLFFSAIISTLLLPRDTQKNTFVRTKMLLQWLTLPFSIIIFGSIPALDAQIRLMRGKYLGFWVTPKER